MSVYIHDIPLPDAIERMRTALNDAGLWCVLGVESIPLDEYSVGRVLAESVWADISSPHYHASAMDGFAVRASDTEGADTASPRTLSEFAYVDTGDPLPEKFDAVIPIENIESLDGEGKLVPGLRLPASIRIRSSVAPWSNVRPLGEDIVQTQLVLAEGNVLRPVDLGAIAAAGHKSVMVARRPRVAILPTGTELVPIGSNLKPGDILEFNSIVLAAQVRTWGGEATRFQIIPDNFDSICNAVVEAARDHDLVLLNAGSSAGMEDYSAKVVERLGTLLVHGVAVRPGHPVILGMLDRKTFQKNSVKNILPQRSDKIPIIGVPGYPVSAALTGEIMVEPLLAHWLGRSPFEPATVNARLTRKVNSPAGDDDYMRVALGRVNGQLLAAPLSRGAGVISSLVRADGITILPRGIQGADAGEEVKVRLYRSASDVERTIFCIGSHDLSLDLLAKYLAKGNRRLTSANVGSQGGLVALRRGEAHLAGSHLLDPKTGEYNVTYLSQYLPDVPVRITALVGREQGLLVRKGNPKGIRDLVDLSRPDVRYINRQRGAGTRVLLDYELSRMGMAAETIQGYNQEEFTHLGVAAAVASGRADCGLGIAGAAQALHLNFVPLFKERYDLIIPKVHAESELLAPLYDVLADAAFRSEVAKIPGYDISVMGIIILEA
jgi:molybdopterin molybdotransferase/putative molybdopterin biosynthesis protein